jgi:hypothetical protein
MGTNVVSVSAGLADERYEDHSRIAVLVRDSLGQAQIEWLIGCELAGVCAAV